MTNTTQREQDSVRAEDTAFGVGLGALAVSISTLIVGTDGLNRYTGLIIGGIFLTGAITHRFLRLRAAKAVRA